VNLPGYIPRGLAARGVIPYSPCYTLGAVKSRIGRLALRYLLLLLFIYAVMAGFVYFRQDGMVYLPEREVRTNPQTIGLAYEEVSFKTRDGVTIAGWFVPSPKEMAVAVFCHGNAGNMGDRLDTIQILNALGLSVLIFDYRGYGRSEGKPSEDGTYLDAEAAWDYLVNARGVLPKRIVIHGRSLGGAVAAELAVKKPSAGVILESTFTSVPDMGEGIYPWLPVRLLSKFRYESIAKIGAIKAPKLIIHSPQDDLVPFGHGKALFQKALPPKEFLEIRGGHNDGFLVSGKTYTEGLGAFFRKLFLAGRSDGISSPCGPTPRLLGCGKRDFVLPEMGYPQAGPHHNITKERLNEMDTPHVIYEVQGHTAVITLNRPEAKNAFSPEMIRLWREHLEAARADDAVRVIVITGKGDTFCSGGDIRDMAEGKLKSWDMKRFLWEGVHRIVLTMEDLDKPVIAAINGAAMGAGMDMAIMCDLRVCSDRAKLAESYIMMGLVPGDGGAYFLPRLVGVSKALELLLTGDLLAADEALKLGIVNKVVPHDRLMAETMALAGKIAVKPPLAVRMMKRAVYQAQTGTLRAHLDYISSQLSLLSETRDHQEAALAFLEKRKPVFEGR
jgi:enoyl-CoA hydratase/carnithine racemase/fermentation-respiration switch protein FrsA (DUF1100 family)